MKPFFHSGFYWWFVPHHLLWVHHRAGSITEYLESFISLRLGSYSHEVKVPFIRASRTSVRFIWAGGGSRNLVARLEVWSNSHYTTPAKLWLLRWDLFRHVNVNEVIKPTNNTGVSLYDKLSPQNVSFYHPKLLNGLTPCEPPFIVCFTSSLKQNSTAYTPSTDGGIRTHVLNLPLQA